MKLLVIPEVLGHCFDEADSINIPACRHMNSLMTWFISSSVHNLCNPNIRYINGNLSGISKTGFT